MPEITIRSNFLTSALVTYHIMCAPTTSSREYNKHLYEKFESGITPEDRGYYLSFLIKSGVNTDKFGNVRYDIFFPGHDCVESLFNQSGKKIRYHKTSAPILEKVVDSMLTFLGRFRPYWKEVEKEINDLIPRNMAVLEENFDRIFTIASEEIPSEEIRPPEKVEVWVVEGLSPSSFGKDRADLHYVIEQLRTFRRPDAFLNTFVHETVPHRIAKKYGSLQEAVLGWKIYDIEEGFAKLMSDKITKKILPDAKIYPPEPMSWEGSYYLYEKNWPLLQNMPFSEWYKMCLEEIKEKITFSPEE